MLAVWTDGAVSTSKPKSPGGYGIAYVHNDLLIETMSGGEYYATNQTMELRAVIVGLTHFNSFEKIRKMQYETVAVFSDSAYVINCMLEMWHVEWKINGWVSAKKGEPIKNKDMWIELLEVVASVKSSGKKITWNKVKGHNGILYNEVADRLAVNAKKRL